MIASFRGLSSAARLAGRRRPPSTTGSSRWRRRPAKVTRPPLRRSPPDAHPPGRAPRGCTHGDGKIHPFLFGPSRRLHQRGGRPPRGSRLRRPRPRRRFLRPRPDRREPRLLRSLQRRRVGVRHLALHRSSRAYLLGARSLRPVGDVLRESATSITFCCSRAISRPPRAETEGRRPCRSVWTRTSRGRHPPSRDDRTAWPRFSSPTRAMEATDGVVGASRPNSAKEIQWLRRERVHQFQRVTLPAVPRGSVRASCTILVIPRGFPHP